GIRDRNVTGVQTCALPISVRADRGHRRVRPQARPQGGQRRLSTEHVPARPGTSAAFEGRSLLLRPSTRMGPSLAGYNRLPPRSPLLTLRHPPLLPPARTWRSPWPRSSIVSCCTSSEDPVVMVPPRSAGRSSNPWPARTGATAAAEVM